MTTSLWVKKAPSAIVQLRTVAKSGVVPVTEVLVFEPPTMTWARPVSSGSIAAASGTAPVASRAVTSSRVRVVAPPPAPRTIPDRDAAGRDEHEVRAESLERARDRGLRALAHRHHADDRGDPDEDPEDREGGPELVRCGRYEGRAKRLVDRHVSRR